MRNVNEGGDEEFLKQSRKRERDETEKDVNTTCILGHTTHVLDALSQHTTLQCCHNSVN